MCFFISLSGSGSGVALSAKNDVYEADKRVQARDWEDSARDASPDNACHRMAQLAVETIPDIGKNYHLGA